MPTIEEMKATLESAGYEIEVVDSETVFGRVTTPDGCQFTVYYGMFIQNTLQEIYQYNRELATKKAYAHYLKEQEHAKMKALLQELVDIYPDYDSNADYIKHIHRMYGEAKAILAEKDATNA